MPESSARSHADELARTYERLHTAKEDAFWAAKMGLTGDPAAAQAACDEGEVALQAFLQDPGRLAGARAALAEAEAAGGDETLELALRGWVATFEAHGIDSAEGRELAREIIEDEGRLEVARGSMPLSWRPGGGPAVRASSVELGLRVRTDDDPTRRRAAWEGLRSIEPFVLEHGFLELVAKRNRLGRMLGAEDYYDWKTRRVEGMTKAEVFALLDELEEATRERARLGVEELRATQGAEAALPWNLQYHVSGDSTREADPYFPFEAAIERWGRSFAALGIDYRGAELVLDLVDREGKYENGFMHGPVVAWRRPEGLQPARIHFTANAIPGMVGSGHRAMATLFHEGGHAAHFANIDMPAPCFGQEFAPTSVGFSETQSMFLDSLLEDPDWQRRYAADGNGELLPMALIEKSLSQSQPFAAWGVRAMLAVCYGEKALYEVPEDELTGERALAELRAVEQRLLFLDGGSPRPVLSVPHLLAGDSSAYYHGYVLAEMAVQQTRRHFLERDGHLVDNPRIGPDLAEAYWRPGNSLSFDTFLERLTGRPLSAADLAARVNRSVDQALDQARAAVARLDSVPGHDGPVALNAKLRVVHGRETVAELTEGEFDAFAGRFAGWVGAWTGSRAQAAGSAPA